MSLDEAQHDGGERLVDLDEVEVVDGDAGLGERLLRRGRRAGEHDRRVGAARRRSRGCAPAASGRAPRRSARCRSPRSDGAVDDAATSCPACGRGRSSRSSGTSAARRRRSRPSRPSPANDGLSLPSVSTVVPGRMNSSWSRTTCSLRSLTGMTESANLPLGLRGRGALLRAGGVRVDVLAAELLDRRDQVGADALRDERRVVVRLGVHRPGAAVGAHRHARHRLDAAGEDEVLPAGGDLLRGDVDGLEARGAEAVELHAGDRVGQAGLDRGGLGDVGALVADRRDAAEHDVVDAVGIELLVADRASRASGRRRGRPAWSRAGSRCSCPCRAGCGWRRTPALRSCSWRPRRQVTARKRVLG